MIANCDTMLPVPRRNPIAVIVGAQFRSADDAQIRQAIATLRPIIVEHDGNLVHVATALGVSRRSLIRWAEQSAELSGIIEDARRK